ncbi:hypothetical protein [Paenibacillus herberti]|uniref:hypothetical protein n=1 Tax=Paenibacillus herberti TaxID=1619309 RepID=UPI001130DDE3|nr:hypothetical protein [Paenibacillus herberti]
MADWQRKTKLDRLPAASRSSVGLVYCLDSGRLQAAEDSHYVFRTGFRTCDGILYPVAVRRSSIRGRHLTLTS